MLNLISPEVIKSQSMTTFGLIEIRHSKVRMSSPAYSKKVMIEAGFEFKGYVENGLSRVVSGNSEIQCVTNDNQFMCFEFNNVTFYYLPTDRMIVCSPDKVRHIKLLLANKIYRKYRFTHIPKKESTLTKFDYLSNYLDTFYLNQETIDQIKECVKPFVSTFFKRRSFGINMNLSIILTGEPGDGKTYSATKMIQYIHRLLRIDIVREEVNTLKLSSISDDFAALLDDMNMAHFSRTGHHAEICQKILSEMDKPETNRLFVLTTNETISKENIDKAFFRPGRVQSIIKVNKPNSKVKNRIIDDLVTLLQNSEEKISLSFNFVAGLKLLSGESSMSLAEMMRLKNLVLSDVIMEQGLKSPKDYISMSVAISPPETLEIAEELNSI